MFVSILFFSDVWEACPTYTHLFPRVTLAFALFLSNLLANRTLQRVAWGWPEFAVGCDESSVGQVAQQKSLRLLWGNRFSFRSGVKGCLFVCGLQKERGGSSAHDGVPPWGPRATQAESARDEAL
jgi:hypothetical protein